MGTQAVPCRCGVCSLVLPTRSALCKHKYEVHKITIKRNQNTLNICRTCMKEFESVSVLFSHKLTAHRSEFFKDGIKSGPKKGVKFNKEHREKISKSLRIFYGTYDPVVPLGLQQLHNPILEDRWCHDYEIWITEVKKRDKYTCQHCGKGKENYLVCHHILPYREFVTSRYDVSNGITLCMSCHMKEEARLKKERINCALFFIQLVTLYHDVNQLPVVLQGSIGQIYFKYFSNEFRKVVQKKHSEYSKEVCSTILNSIRIDA